MGLDSGISGNILTFIFFFVFFFRLSSFLPFFILLRILSSLKCDDRVFSSFTFIWDRLINKQDTFGVFIDFLKAFDFFIGMSNTYYINLFQMELTENSITPENPNYPIQHHMFN